MFNVTTKYDKIYDEELGKEVRKKVFMIRGDEAYARSTDIVLAYSTPVSGDVKGFKTSLTATVLRNVGSSKVAFYDGEELLGMIDVGSGVHTASLSNIYLSYVVEHQLYAEFVGNSQCLGSKSKKISVSEPIPSSLETSITFNNPTTQINTGGTVTISATARMNGETVEDGTEILFYDGSTLIDVCTTTDGVASITTGAMTEGKHTIRAVIESTSTLNGTTSSYDLLVGYNIQFHTYPDTIINGIQNTVKISVKKWDGTAVGGASVSLTDQSNQTTNASGIATFIYTNATSKNYTASYNGSSKTMILYAFTPTSILLSSNKSIVGQSETANIVLTLNGSGDINQIVIPITGATVSPSQDIVVHGGNTGYVDYIGDGSGDVTITATLGNVSKSYTIKDYLFYWTPTLKKNASSSTIVVNGGFSETSTGMVFAGISNSSMEFVTQCDGSQMEFDVVSLTTSSIGLGTTEHNFIDSTLSANDHVRITLQGGVQRTYVNEELKNTTSYTASGRWAFIYPSNLTGSHNIKINNVKIKRL